MMNIERVSGVPDPERAGHRRWARTAAWHRLGATLSLVVLASLGGMGCSLDGLLHSDELPSDVNDPALTETPNGARAAYNDVLAKFRAAFAGGALNDSKSFVAMTGLLTDELQLYFLTGAANVDSRTLPEGNGSNAENTYSDLQKTRGEAGQAIGLLADYLSEQPALAGHLYAIQGYTELFLAEFFCSGVPLSTIDYGGDYTYRAGSSTAQIFAHAAALFDTALALAGDSARIVQLARVGRGRALLGAGEYAAAAAAVGDVPDGYRYEVNYNTVTSGSGSALNFANAVSSNGSGALQNWNFTVPDREGANGQPWLTSGDPRTPLEARGTTLPPVVMTLYYPSNYDPNGGTPVVLASAVEARLIEAEAALQAGSGTWLTILNALRTDGTFDTTATSPPDTLWYAGSGGVAGLRPLTDPGTDAGRVDLLFRERAFWLFLTGHRQGDLRRLIRQYGRLPQDLYPVGTYPANTLIPYGADITVPIPIKEYVNPLYTGCISRGA